MIIQGNAFKIPLADNSVHSIITSPPYWGLRDYNLPPMIFGGHSDCRHEWGELQEKHDVREASITGKSRTTERFYGDESRRFNGNHEKHTTGQFCRLCNAWLGNYGLEPKISLYVQHSVEIARELRRVLRNDGVMFWNLGDSYATGKNGRSAADTKAVGKDDRTFRDKPFSITELPAKNLCGIPWRVALALQDDGWILRSEMPWLKANAMPSSVTDRPGTAHEHVFMLVKSARYYYDMEAVRKPAQNRPFAGKEAKTKRPNDTPWHDNRYAPGASGYGHHPNGRALRTSDAFFDSLDAYIAHLQDIRDNGGMLVDSEGLPAALVVNTESFGGLHYATFPRKLVAPLVKVTPEKVCPECGAPWKRIIEVVGKLPKQKWGTIKKETADNYSIGPMDRGGNGQYQTGGIVTGEYLDKRTTGWQPTCKCIQNRAPNFGMKGSELLELADEVIKELAPIGGIIFDPFCGSGTVGEVSKEHGRRFVGIDLSAKYLQENALPRSERKTSSASIKTLPMFADLDEAA